MPNFDHYIDSTNRERTTFIADYLPSSVRLPDGTTARINGMDADKAAENFVEIVREFVGDDFATALQAFLNGCAYGQDIENGYYADSVRELESSVDDYHAAVVEITNLCDEFENKIRSRPKLTQLEILKFVRRVRDRAYRSY